MRHSNNKNLMKAFGLLVLCCLVPFSAIAQTKGYITPSGWNNHCMPVKWHSTATSVPYHLTGITHKAHGYSWWVAGDLKIDGISSDSMEVWVSSYSTRDKDFGKGRIYASYWEDTISGVCGNPTVSYDVYKTFKDTTTKIVGPDCIDPKDTVTFSIDAMVSVNLNAGIGMDHYYWSFSNGLVNRILYYSGDSSSVTFLPGTLTGHDTIFVDMGQCNFSDGFRYTKVLGQAVKTPTFAAGFEPPTCLPFNVALDTIIISNPQTKVKYEWDFGSWTIKHISTPGDTVIFIPASNAQTITLTAVGPCETKEFKYTVTRSLTKTNTITAGLTPKCQPASTNVQFGVSGVPDGTIMEWSVRGTGWSISSADVKNTNPYITTGTDVGYVSVKTAACPYTITDTIFIQPTKPGAITGDTCLTRGNVTSKTYSVPAVAHANSYEWKYPKGWTVSGDSIARQITLIPNGTSADSIKVRAVGCSKSAWRSQQISLNGVKPTGFTSSKTCINAGGLGMPDTLTYTVAGGVSGQTYNWKIDSVFGKIHSFNADSSQIVVYTKGIEGTYEVLVRAHTGCGYTDYDTTSVTIQGLNFTVAQMQNSSKQYYYKLTPTNSEWDIMDYTIKWVLNDTIVTNSAYSDRTKVGMRAGLATSTSNDFYVTVTNPTTGCITKRKATSTGFRSATISDVTPSLEIYPNPTNSVLNVTLSVEGVASIVITDYLGKIRKTLETQSQNFTIDVSDLSNGTYLIIVNQNNQRFGKEFIIKK